MYLAQDSFHWWDFVIRVMGTSYFMSSIRIFLVNHEEKSRNFTIAILTTCVALCRVSVCEIFYWGNIAAV